MMRTLLSLLTLSALSTLPAVSADDWPQWRGENQDGVSAETAWTAEWGDSEPRELWRRVIGDGNGAPSVVGNRLYATASRGRTSESDIVFCLDASTGDVLWTHSYDRVEGGKRLTKRAATNTTPTVDGDWVYIFSSDAQLFCLNALNGEVAWKVMLLDEPESRHAQYGCNASPVIVGDLVVVLADLHDASILAFDKRAGKEVWRAHHATRNLGGFWSTPVHRSVDSKDCLVYLSGLAVVGIDPKSGKTQWKFDFEEASFEKARRGAVAAQAIVHDDKVFFPFHPDHNRGFSACIEVEKGKPTLLWKSMELAHWWHSPVLWKGHVYGIDQGPAAEGTKAGALYCYEFGTGVLKWSTRAFGEESRGTLLRGGKFFIADGQLVVLNDYGYLQVAKVGRSGFEPLASVKLPLRQGKNWTVPVLSGGRLFCRDGRGTLFCFETRAPNSAASDVIPR